MRKETRLPRDTEFCETAYNCLSAKLYLQIMTDNIILKKLTILKISRG